MKKKYYVPIRLSTYNRQEKSRIFRIKNLADFKKENKSFRLSINPRIKKVQTIRDVEVWIVSGSKIRDRIEVDFTAGGHTYRYGFISHNEIWIDNAIDKKDIFPTIWHEFTERQLMERGINYDEAHHYAASAEIGIRNNIEFVLPVTNFSQSLPISCGAAALKIVLEYFGVNKSEKEIITLAKTSIHGTDPVNLVTAAKELGFKVKWKQGFTIKEVKSVLLKGCPIIANFQLSPKYGEGHYAVIIGFTKKEFIFSDPHSEKDFHKIKIKGFMKQWHELEDNTIREGIVLYR